MGYKTYHHLEFEPSLTKQQIIEAITEDSNATWEHLNYMSYVLSEPYDDMMCMSAEPGKWDEDPDMIKLSATYPFHRFTLTVGDAEEGCGPQYVKYYRNGQVETAVPKVIIPPPTIW